MYPSLHLPCTSAEQPVASHTCKSAPASSQLLHAESISQCLTFSPCLTQDNKWAVFEEALPPVDEEPQPSNHSALVNPLYLPTFKHAQCSPLHEGRSCRIN